MTRFSKAVSILCLVIVTGCLVSVLFAQKVPDQLPDLSLRDLDGKSVALRSFQSKALLVNFWATWCTPCTSEMPLFVGLKNKYRDRGFELVGVNIWDDADKARRFAQKISVNYPILVGDDASADAFGGFPGLPATFLVDGSGRIVQKYYAVDEKGLAAMEKDIVGLLDTGALVPMPSGVVSNISLFTAFLAGILSFLSPCVLPLIPSYISFITGISYEEFMKPGGLSRQARRATIIHSLLFIAGFSLIFILLGASATYVGGLFTTYRSILEKVVGVIIVVFGLHISGIVNIKFLLMEKKMHLESKPLGYLGTVVVGFSFGVGWTPCIGPILGSILGFAATMGNLGSGILLLGFYSLGLGIPFLISAIAVQSFFDYFKKIRAYIPAITKGSGIFLVLVGALIFSGYFVKLAALFQSWMNTIFPWLGNLG
jgi:cytochrome c-type biogenesis protein